jgi:uncharacterized protein (TIGR02145 family)
MSVPYAMYATQADTVLKVPDESSTNEIQLLSISNDTIYLSNGGFAKLPPYEPQNLSVSKSGDTLYLSGGNHIIIPGITLANYPPIDIDGNVYDTVQIGTQLWMKSNLKTTKYNDGTVIPNVIDNTVWMGLTTGARTYYNNDSITYKPTYGALYNWFAVNTGKLCPIGWHVPTDEEWTVLSDFLGGADVAGGKMKTTGTEYWNAPNEGATNESGFNGLPGGYRYGSDNTSFRDILDVGYFWSSSDYNGWAAWSRLLGSQINSIGREPNEHVHNAWHQTGASIRCIKD